ncbi:hypothetical protein N9C35_01195 [Flavobacteriaceae bacterium]|nr:hypothetical protein [Flavobacteriaceae bacterium]
MKFILQFFIISLLMSCVSHNNRGYSFEHEDYSFIKKGLSKKQYVLESMGQPTIKDQDSWIYFGEKTENILFIRPWAIKRKIIFLKFDKNETVAEIKNFTLDDQSQISFNNDKTKIDDKNKNLIIEALKSTLKNIGQGSIK